MFSLWVAPDVIKELGDVKRYPAKVARQLLLKILDLATTPRPQDSIAIESGFRVTSGEFRLGHMSASLCFRGLRCEQLRVELPCDLEVF